MNHILKTLIITLLSFFVLTGCSGTTPILEAPLAVKKEDKILIVEQKVNPFNETLEKEGRTKNQQFIIATGIALDVVLKKIAEETLNEGHSHFIITTKSLNGFLGLPINNKNDLLEYCMAKYYTNEELRTKCGGVVDFNIVRLKALPISKFSYTVTAWDAKKVLDEVNASKNRYKFSER